MIILECYYTAPVEDENDEPDELTDLGACLIEGNDALFVRSYPEGGGTEPEEFYVITRNHKTNSGLVHTAPYRGTDILEDLKRAGTEALPDDTETFEIPEDGVFDTGVILDDGREVNLVVEPVPDNKITKHFKIPLALMYPDTSYPTESYLEID